MHKTCQGAKIHKHFSFFGLSSHDAMKDVVWLYSVVHIVYAEGYYTLQEYFNFQNRKKENTVTEYPDFEWIKYCVRISLQLTPTWQTVNNTC